MKSANGSRYSRSCRRSGNAARAFRSSRVSIFIRHDFVAGIHAGQRAKKAETTALRLPLGSCEPSTSSRCWTRCSSRCRTSRRTIRPRRPAKRCPSRFPAGCRRRLARSCRSSTSRPKIRWRRWRLRSRRAPPAFSGRARRWHQGLWTAGIPSTPPASSDP